MNALAFRGVPRLIAGSDQAELVRLGVWALMCLFRPEIKDNRLSDAVEDWPRTIVAWQRNANPEMLRNIWTKTCGGVGARDIWDVTRVLMDKPCSQHLFVIVACLPALASVVIGGNYGTSVAVALSQGLRKHLPSAMVSAGDLERVAAEYIFAGANVSVREMCRRYILQLSLGVSMERPTLMAGVLNHFLEWCGEVSNRESATAEDVVLAMEKYPLRARKYLKECDGTRTMTVRRGGAGGDARSVVTNMSVTGKRRDASMLDGGCHQVLLYAERKWEAGICVSQKNI